MFLHFTMCKQKKTILIQNWIVWNFYKNDLICHSMTQKRLMCHKTINQTRMLMKPWSRCFERTDGMQSAQGYSRISTWLQHIPIHNLPPLEKDRKTEQPLGVWVPHILCEKNKEEYLSIATSLLSRQRYYHFSRWWKMDLLWPCSMQKAPDW